MANTEEKIHNTVNYVYELFIEKKYQELEQLSQGVRLSAKEMSDAIIQYGRSLCSLPSTIHPKLNIVEVSSVTPRRWNVSLPVYTKEEGLSDLTLELTLVETNEDIYGFEIDDLHVL